MLSHTKSAARTRRQGEGNISTREGKKKNTGETSVTDTSQRGSAQEGGHFLAGPHAERAEDTDSREKQETESQDRGCASC